MKEVSIIGLDLAKKPYSWSQAAAAGLARNVLWRWPMRRAHPSCL